MSNWHKQRGITETGPQVIALGERMTRKEIEALECKHTPSIEYKAYDSALKDGDLGDVYWESRFEWKQLSPEEWADQHLLEPAVKPAPHPWQLGCECSSCRMVIDLLERGQIPESEAYAAERRRLNLDMEMRKKALDRLISYQRIKPYDAP